MFFGGKLFGGDCGKLFVVKIFDGGLFGGNCGKLLVKFVMKFFWFPTKKFHRILISISRGYP